MHLRQHVIAMALLSAVLTAGAATGCASQKTTTVRTVTAGEPDSAANTENARPRAQTETTTTTTQSDRSPGVIGSAFRLVWAVIAFPFRVIGDLF